MAAIMIPTRHAADLIAGHWALLQRFGAVPRELVWGNEGAVGSWRGGKPKLAEEFEAVRGVLGIAVHQCKPNDPEAKGLVERGNRYYETSFLPGRSFTGPADFTAQMGQWIDVRANQRHHRALGCRPVQRGDADRSAMLALPPVAPAVGWRPTVRLPRDYYVRVDANDYSVHPSVIGRRVEVVADLARVTVTCGGKLVADHERVWAQHQTITDPEHAAAASVLRQARSPLPALQHAGEVEQRPLSDYDAVFGRTEAVA